MVLLIKIKMYIFVVVDVVVVVVVIDTYKIVLLHVPPLTEHIGNNSYQHHDFFHALRFSLRPLRHTSGGQSLGGL